MRSLVVAGFSRVRLSVVGCRLSAVTRLDANSRKQLIVSSRSLRCLAPRRRTADNRQPTTDNKTLANRQPTTDNITLANQQPATSNISWLLCTLLLIAPAAFANIATSSITGRVTVSGRPAEGVTVTAESPSLQQPRTTLSGPRGTYWLGALPPGEYDVTFTLPGHTTVTRRAIAELGRVARSDAMLEPNEDEESVTSTATTPNVTETTAITTHFDDRELDRLPLGRDKTPSVASDLTFFPYATLDGVPPFLGGVSVSEDLIEQTTVLRGGAPVEVDGFLGSLLAIRTRRGGEDLSLSLRDTLSNPMWVDNDLIDGNEETGVRHKVEATAGGRIVTGKLWFFAGAWNGDDVTRYVEDQQGFNVKLQAQTGPAHHLEGSYFDSRDSAGIFRSERQQLSLEHTAVAGPRLTWRTEAARTSIANSLVGGSTFLDVDGDFLASTVSYVTPTRSGDHLWTAGVSRYDTGFAKWRALYAADRWSSSRWVVDAGLRYDHTNGYGRLTPRVAVTYDLGRRGTSALSASYGQYTITEPAPVSVITLRDPRILTLGYVTAIGSAGTLRVDAIHNDRGAMKTNSLQLDTRYRLFDRFEAGATYAYTRTDYERFFAGPDQQDVANVWFAAELPFGDHELGVTLLQRLLVQSYNPSTTSPSVYPTDLALRYTLPFPRFRLTLAADATNVLAAGSSAGFPRALRFWVRARL